MAIPTDINLCRHSGVSSGPSRSKSLKARRGVSNSTVKCKRWSMYLYIHNFNRSEEPYRSWEPSQKHHLSRDRTLRPSGLFQINISASALRDADGLMGEVDYRSWLLHYYRITCFGEATGSCDAQNRVSEFFHNDGNVSSIFTHGIYCC